MKQRILDELKKRVQQEIDLAEEASESSSEYVKEGDIKSDGKYDTRGIEASYLAGAQKKRVEELKLELKLLEETPVSVSKEVSIGSLVDLELNGQTRKYYIATTSGGTILNFDGETILVISSFSPLGDALLGQEAGDEIEIETPQGNRTYLIHQLS